MNFLSSAFSSLTGNSIPYTFKEKIVDPKSGSFPDSTSVWTIYNGLNKANNAPVAIFECSLTDPVNISKDLVSLARNCFRKSKMLKLPGIISVVDFIESESYLYIITEPVVPLSSYLSQSAGSGSDSKIFGVHSIGLAMSLVNQSQYLHGKLNLTNSVFVTRAGDWKLFGLELLTNLQSDPDQPIYRLSKLEPGFDSSLPEDVIGNSDLIRQFPLKLDSYKFGVFIYSVFNHSQKGNSPINYTNSELQNMKNVPKQLASSAKKLVNQKSSLRPTVEKFMKDAATYFDQNKLVLFNHELEELKFKNDNDKLSFFKHELGAFTGNDNSEEEDDLFPSGFLEFKLLPELISQYQNIFKAKPSVNTTPEEHAQRQETISVLLNYILTFGANLEEATFSSQIKPVILQAFSLPDRSIRLSLLNHLNNYIKYLTESDIQNKIFYNLLTGFQDTNYMIRETTLKSITTVIDKVSVKQVNQDLLKVLAKSQMDPKPSIRTNTLVLIIKISSKIYNTSKNNVLITALSKSLKDSFVPCKMMALSGFESLIKEFSLNEICGKILGHLAIALMDEHSHKVRTEARRVFDLYLQSVEEHASSLPQDDVDEEEEEKIFFAKHAPVTSTSSESVTESSSNDYSIGIGGFRLGLTKMNPKGTLNNDFNVSTPDLTRVGTPTLETPNFNTNQSTNVDTWNDFDVDESWGGEDVVDEVVDDTPKKPATINTSTRAPRKSSGLKLGKKTAAAKPKSALKLNLKVEDDDDNWGGDW
ncbi:cytoplasmic export protein 1 [[Candida] railenensis]|uniref:Cytoplasmic export protein 1 n=1 Tax=[Candida] railenensis TaxID=45579 RepID=A0A9P0W1A0_9ASCO|nr:cytoplasmic export protein 1 [[Candida] railenensis]